jgi:fibronectin type 3 domain-containing protein
MRTLPTLILLTSLSLTPLGLAAAQINPQSSPQPVKAGVAALPTPDGALLRWFLPGDVIPSGGFLLQVTGAAGARSVAVASPQPFTAALGLTRDEYNAVTAIYAPPITDESNRVQRAIFSLNVVARPAYARALGILTTLTGLPPGPHTVTVYAVNGKSQTRVGSATFRTGSTSPVPAPSALKVGAVPAAARLTWAAPAGAESSLVVAYNVYRAPATGPFARLEPAPFFRTQGAGGDVFSDAAIQPGVPYRYQVTSVDLFGRESLPTAPVTLPVRAALPLISPELTRATPGNRAVTLEWTPNPDPRIRTLLVLRGITPESLTVIARLGPTASTYVDKDVQGGVPYLYALAAADETGRVGGRGTLTGATGQNLTPPAAPSGLTVTPGERALTLTWAANSETDLRGYRVYRSEGEQSTAQEILLTGLPITATTYLDAIPQGVQARYHYRVVAVNTTQIESAPSVTVTAALLDTTPPPPPVLAAVIAGPTSLTLNWIQAEVPDLTGFEVIRTTDKAPETVLTTLSAAIRTYEDTSAVPGVPYSYSLRSLDRAGNRSQPAVPIRAALPAPAGSTLPTGLRATLLPEKAGVQLRWTTGPSPARYVVYRLSGTLPLQVSDLLSGQSFTDPQGQADSQYVIRAVSSSGELSEPTPTLHVNP